MIPPRRVLHLIDSLDEYSAAASLRELCVGLGKSGWDCRAVALRGTPRGAALVRVAGVQLQVLQRRWPLDPVVAREIRRIYADTKPDLLHCWDLASLAYAALLRLGGDRRSIFLRLDADQLRPDWASIAVKRCRRRLAGVFAEDASTAAWCRRQGVAQHQIIPMPPGLPSLRGNPRPRADLLQLAGLGPEAKVVAVAGKLRRANGIDQLVWCFELVRILQPDSRLLVFGEGRQRSSIERFARLASDPRSVQLLGYRADFPQLLPQVDVFWSCRAAGRMPRSLIEAMRAGVPVVAADVPAARSAVNHGRDGLVAEANRRREFARHTVQLLQDADLSKRLGEAGAATAADRFSIDRVLRSCIDAFEKAP